MKRYYFPILFLLLFAGTLSYAVDGDKQSEKYKVEKIEKAGLIKLIGERGGKPLLLNLWATWCVPCREEFPSINKLAGEFKGADFAGISIDFPEEIETKIVPFLKSQKAKFISYVSGFEKDEELINILDENWNGALPATFIFDKNGKKIAFLEGKRTYQELKSELKKALN
ncbi:MAG: TlpA disulfide reductase family protein [Melioribacteraceae bacterium]